MKKTVFIFMLFAINSFSQEKELIPFKENGRWGFMNRAGKEIIQPKYDKVHHFYDGLAAIELDDLWGFIDKKGQIKIEPKYRDVYHFSEGLCAVSTIEAMSNGGSADEVIDKNGKIIFKGDFYFFHPYKNGEAHYWEGYDMTGKHIFIDKKGKVIKTE